MELQQLRYFVAAVRTGSVTQAARECGVVQTTVSHALTSLEREYGVSLLERDRKGVVASQMGMRVYQDACAVVERAGAVEHILRSKHLPASEQLRIGYYDSGLGAVFPEVIRDYQAVSGTEVQLVSALDCEEDVLHLIETGKLDAGLVACGPLGAAVPWSTGEIVRFLQPYLVMSQDDDLATQRGTIGRDELAGMADTLLIYRASNTSAYADGMRSWYAREFLLNTSLVTWSSDRSDVVLKTRCGQCRTILFRSCEKPRLSEGDLTLRRISGIGYMPVSLIFRRDAADPRITTFASVARKVCSAAGIDVEKAMKRWQRQQGVH